MSTAIASIPTITIRLAASNLTDVQAFIQEHQESSERIAVEVVRQGLGDGFADYLEDAGFSVKRI